MLEKQKSLLWNGKIEVVRFNQPCKKIRIFDIPKKLKLIKAQRLQLQTLGYIANGGQIEGRERIMVLLNGRINKFTYGYHFFDDSKYKNYRSLVNNLVANPEKLTKSHVLYRHCCAAYNKTNMVKGVESKHSIIIQRLFRNNKACSLFHRIEELLDFDH